MIKQYEYAINDLELGEDENGTRFILEAYGNSLLELHSNATVFAVDEEGYELYSEDYDSSLMFEKASKCLEAVSGETFDI